MVQIRPVSDLRNKFTDIEKCVQRGDPVYLTKNGYGTMVVLSLDSYSRLTEPEEYAMDIADTAAESTDERLTHEQVCSRKSRKHPYYRIYVRNYIIYYVVLEEHGKKIMEVRRFMHSLKDRDNKI